MKAFEQFTAALDAAATVSDAAAKKIGYGAPLSPADKQRVIESLLFAVEMFQRLARDVEAVMTKALTLVGSEASTLAQTVAAVTKEVADHDKRTADERRERENASWLNK